MPEKTKIEPFTFDYNPDTIMLSVVLKDSRGTPYQPAIPFQSIKMGPAQNKLIPLKGNGLILVADNGNFDGASKPEISIDGAARTGLPLMVVIPIKGKATIYSNDLHLKVYYSSIG